MGGRCFADSAPLRGISTPARFQALEYSEETAPPEALPYLQILSMLLIVPALHSAAGRRMGQEVVPIPNFFSVSW